MVRVGIGVVSLLFTIGAPAAAQQASTGAPKQAKVGLAMGYPAAIGILWHVSDRVAVRPDFNIAKSSNTSGPDSAQVTGDTWALGAGIGALFYISRTDNLRMYVSPRLGYSHGSNSTSAPNLAYPVSNTTLDSYQVAGSFGAQYALHPRFSIYGEAGFQYSTTDSTFSAGSLAAGKTTGYGWGTRTALGVVLYLR